MSPSADDPPIAATPAHQGDEIAGVGLLHLVAELVGLDAVILVVADDENPRVVRTSWPVNRAGLECDDSTEAGRSRLLIAAGGAGGSIVTATAEIDTSPAEIDTSPAATATVHGSLDTRRGVSSAAAARALPTLVRLIASLLSADIARRHSEDVRVRLAGMVDALGHDLSLRDLLTRIVQSARELLDVRYAALGVLDATRTKLVEFITTGMDPEEIAAIGALPTGGGLLGALIRDPVPLRLERMGDDPRSEGFPPHHPPMNSFLGVPIILHGEVFGSLYLTDKAGGPFTAEDEQVAVAFALQAAIAVDNVRRYEVTRATLAIHARDLRMHELAFEIERAIRSASGTQQALDVMCAILGKGLGADRVLSHSVNADRNVVHDVQWHLPDLPPLGDTSHYQGTPRVGRLAEELWQSSKTRALNDYLGSEASFKSKERAQDFQRATGARAIIFAPIGLGDRVIGMIYVIMVNQPREWTPSEANAVQQVAAFVAQVIVDDEHQKFQNEYIDRLERLDQQKTNFLATVSHELRTPLTSISGYLELLQDGDVGELTGEQHQVLEVVDRNTSRLTSLIGDLLVLNQIESGGLKLNVTGVSMRELITHAGEELYPLVSGGAVELDIDAGPEAAIVQGDRGHLHRAVVNIVSNAIKFSHPEGVVTIRCTLDQGARRVLFTCEDNGIGIPADDQEQLFSRFYRASNATDQAIAGTGLGLVIVKQIVEDHGGELRLTSVEGEGTTVVIDLPLSAPD